MGNKGDCNGQSISGFEVVMCGDLTRLHPEAPAQSCSPVWQEESCSALWNYSELHLRHIALFPCSTERSHSK